MRQRPPKADSHRIMPIRDNGGLMTALPLYPDPADWRLSVAPMMDWTDEMA